MNFISEANKMIHKEELVRMKHKRSIFEKSYGMTFRTLHDVGRARMAITEREELARLLTKIILHEIYFSSFCRAGNVSERIRKQYGSEASFLYELYECTKEADGGFLLIFNDKVGRIDYCAGRDCGEYLRKRTPVLALDLEEHAYFYDYLFERDRYVSAALSELDLSKI